MRLEIRRLPGDERISGGVRPVEPVAGELLHQVEELHRLRSRQLVLFGARDEDVALQRHLLGFLLAHRTAEQIGGAERVAADHLRDLHHLFLVHHDAVGRLEDRRESRVEVFDALASTLARDVIGDELHRAGPVQRDQRDDVLEARRRRLLHQVAHAARFELEHRRRVALAENIERRPSSSGSASSATTTADRARGRSGASSRESSAS